MKIIPFLIVFFLVGAFVFDVAAPEASRVAPDVSPIVLAQVSPVDESGDYMLCGISMPDNQIVLVSENLADCGDSITIKFIDDTVISTQVAGILLDAPKNTVQAVSVIYPETARISTYR